MTELDEIGPIDYIVVEWPDKQPTGEAIPHLLDLVDNGTVRILDLMFVTKDEAGNVAVLDINELGETFAVFEGASSGLLGDDDVQEAAGVLDPGTSAAVLVWENRWAAPFAVALRKSGAQLVASGRIPVQELVAALETADAAS